MYSVTGRGEAAARKGATDRNSWAWHGVVAVVKGTRGDGIEESWLLVICLCSLVLLCYGLLAEVLDRHETVPLDPAPRSPGCFFGGPGASKRPNGANRSSITSEASVQKAHQVSC